MSHTRLGCSQTTGGCLRAMGGFERSVMRALVGIAPLNRDSGTRHGRRAVWGGRAHVRAALHMAALATSKHNPTIRASHTRLHAAGKAPTVALVACMRKLLIILNIMLRHRVPWRPVIVQIP